MAARRVFSIALDPEKIARLDDLADARGISRSRLIEQYIDEAMQEDETTVRVLSDPVLLRGFAQAFKDKGMIRRLLDVVSGEGADPDQLHLFQQSLQHVADQMNQDSQKKPKMAKKKGKKA